MKSSVLLSAVLSMTFAVACSDDSATSGSDGGSGGGSTTGTTTSASAGGGGAASTSSTGGSEPVSDVHLVGRYDSSMGAPRASWSGSSARTRISGDAVSVRLDGASNIYFEIVIDGASVGRFRTDGGDKVYELATGLAGGEHDVEIVRRNEGYFGNVSFLGFETPGTIVPTPSPYKHRIEFIGDSLTCGFGIEGPNAECPFTADTESAYSTYAAVASRTVSAAANIVCFSGKGVHQNYGGNTDETMPELYDRTLTNEGTPSWDYASFVAEAVVINLGTNDFSAALDDSAFVSDYVALLGRVRGNYPNAAIFAVTWAHWGASKEALVTNAVQQSGDANTETLRFTIEQADGLGCAYHTNIVTNAKLGKLLSDRLTEKLGW